MVTWNVQVFFIFDTLGASAANSSSKSSDWTSPSGNLGARFTEPIGEKHFHQPLGGYFGGF
jgi:hypothetical protein